MKADECNEVTSGTWQIRTLLQDFGWQISTEVTTWKPRENILQANMYLREMECVCVCVIRLTQSLAVVPKHCIQTFVSLETWTFFGIRAGFIISLLESPCAIKLVIKQPHCSRQPLIYIKKSRFNLYFCLD